MTFFFSAQKNNVDSGRKLKEYILIIDNALFSMSLKERKRMPLTNTLDTHDCFCTFLNAIFYLHKNVYPHKHVFFIHLFDVKRRYYHTDIIFLLH
jgi:hypothetical protein